MSGINYIKFVTDVSTLVNNGKETFYHFCLLSLLLFSPSCAVSFLPFPFHFSSYIYPLCLSQNDTHPYAFLYSYFVLGLDFLMCYHIELYFVGRFRYLISWAWFVCCILWWLFSFTKRSVYVISFPSLPFSDCTVEFSYSYL